MLRLDHVVLAVDDLDTAMRAMSDLEFTVLPGGEHGSGTTRNALIVFQDGTYVELLAPTGRQRASGNPATDFSPMHAGGEGWGGYALLTDDLAAERAALHARGVQVGDAQPGSRQKPSGETVRWQLATIEDGFSPFLIQDETPRSLRVPPDPSVVTHRNGVLGIQRLLVVVPDLERGSARYERIVGQAPDRVEGQARFALGETSLDVTTPTDDAMRERMARRADTLVEVVFRTSKPSASGEHAVFGARLAIR